jgi:hypothetical protein
MLFAQEIPREISKHSTTGFWLKIFGAGEIDSRCAIKRDMRGGGLRILKNLFGKQNWKENRALRASES